MQRCEWYRQKKKKMGEGLQDFSSPSHKRQDGQRQRQHVWSAINDISKNNCPLLTYANVLLVTEASTPHRGQRPSWQVGRNPTPKQAALCPQVSAYR